MADLKKTVEILFEGNDQASRKAADVIGKVREMEAATKTAAVDADKLGDSLDKIGTKSVAIDAAAAALKTLAATLVADRFIDANVAYERFIQSMTVAKGSAAAAAAEFEYVSNVSQKLGVNAIATAESYAFFTNSVKNTSIEGEGARRIFEAFAGTMSRVGASSVEISGAFVQLAQGISKGKFELDDLKSIAERMPGFFVAFADSLGVTTPELFKLISAGKIGADEMLKFADALNKGLDGATFEGYQRSLERLKNTIDQTFINIGKAGAFDLLIRGIEAVTATLTGAISAIKLFGELIGNFFYLLTTAGDSPTGIFGADWSGFINNAKESLDKAASSTTSLYDALTKTRDEGAKAGDAIKTGMDAAKKPTDEAAKSTAELDALLKKLGVDPKKTTEGIEQLARDLEALAKNPKANGEQFALAFEAAIKKVGSADGLRTLQKTLFDAFEGGKINAAQLEKGLSGLDKAFEKIAGSGPKAGKGVDEAAKASAKAAADLQKAEEAAQRFRIEMEKIASNERIKLIEAKVTLNVAQIEADTKRIEASFESINNTVNSTGDLLGDLFGLLKDYDSLSFAAIRLIEKQIDQENTARQNALVDQRKLIDAQIREIHARTRAIEKGDSLIKVDGAGLQPHLEAFMWEILRTIQVRANQDGLAMLLGT